MSTSPSRTIGFSGRQPTVVKDADDMSDKKKYLLREFYQLCADGVCQDLLTEEQKIDIKENGTMYLTGIIQRADEVNGNGRIYPKTVLEREMKNYQKLIDEKRAFGQLDHPEDSVVELKDVSHMLVDYQWKGPDVYGTIKVLNTPAGRIIQEIVKSGGIPGISSRGLGSVKEQNGNTIVEDDYQIVCYDVVSDPSTTGAFMSLVENKVPMSKVFTKADRLNRKLNAILDDK